MTTIQEVTVGDRFRYYGRRYHVTSVDPVSETLATQDEKGGMMGFYFPALEIYFTGKPATGDGWEYQYQKTALTPANPLSAQLPGAPTPANVSPRAAGLLAPATWQPAPFRTGHQAPIDQKYAGSLLITGHCCPACGGEVEHKVFSSFSYYYCPACKEDISALKPKALPSSNHCDCSSERFGNRTVHKASCSTQNAASFPVCDRTYNCGCRGCLPF